ncbi:CPBP family intramembrane metalloprotease [Luteibacter pinisoli]|uniref:CPBP family intramembrane metalloprotease n=1 Tax=Luteibacter pinisoli TaxID=2589080 RepID=A0A4Y5Z7Y8_9GAMM|nr:CPBP family intramembrane glutamic endopeptidase [Luteibacter pinisoli]QDE40649.1 CPBP family intramembrane metalloprotease [Luteibacter pinisoli]
MSSNDVAVPRPALPLRLLRSPVGRIVAFAVMAWLIGMGCTQAYKALGLPHGAIPFGEVTPLIELFRLLPIVLAYWLLVRFIERRHVDELAARKLVPHVLLGLVAGFVLFSLVVGCLAALGAYVVDGTNTGVPWLGLVLVLGVGAGVGEEIVSRGVLFRIVEEGLGTWISLLISAAFFGCAHIWNPHATTWSALAIALEAGLLFGLIYHVTRSLWLCMGVHAAWNVAQGPFYGIPVSGFEQKGWLASHMQGPDWLTGGEFGAEASVVALCICSTLTAVLLAVAVRRGSLVPPFWRRRAAKATA